MLDEIEYSKPFYDSIDPYGTGQTLLDSPYNQSNAYVRETEERMLSTITKSNNVLRKQKVCTTLLDLADSLDSPTPNDIEKSVLYYSLYEYYNKMSSEESFYNTRTSAINMFLKADARGTVISDFIIRTPISVVLENTTQSSEMSYYEYYSDILSGSTVSTIFQNVSSSEETEMGIPHHPDDAPMIQDVVAHALQKTKVSYDRENDDEEVLQDSYNGKNRVRDDFLENLSSVLDGMSMLEKRVFIRQNTGKKWKLKIAMSEGYSEEYIIGHTEGDSLFANQSIPIPNSIHVELSRSALLSEQEALDLDSVYDRQWIRWNMLQEPLPSPLYIDSKVIPEMPEYELKDWILKESRRQIELAYLCFNAYYTSKEYTTITSWTGTSAGVSLDSGFMLTHMIISSQQPQ